MRYSARLPRPGVPSSLNTLGRTPVLVPTFPTLGNSLAMEAFGAEASISTLDADGFYTGLHTGADSYGHGITSSAPIDTDYVAEVVFTRAAALNSFIGIDESIGTVATTVYDQAVCLNVYGAETSSDLYSNDAGTYDGAFPIKTHLFFIRVGTSLKLIEAADYFNALNTAPFFTYTVGASDPHYLVISLRGSGDTCRAKFLTKP